MGAPARILPLAPYERTIGDCAFCPKMCRFACPVAEAEASEAATPAWKGALIRLWAEGRLPLAGAVAEAAYKCTDCLLQRTFCAHGHETPAAYAAVRARAVAEGAAPERARTFVERVRRLGNPFEAALDRKLAGALPPGTPLLEAGARADLVFFPGCAAVARAPDAARDAAAVLARVESLARARPEGRVPCSAAGAGCCGLPLFAAGDLEGFRAFAERLAPALSRAREIAVLDPGCAYAIDVLWREHAGIELPARVVTLAERLAARLDHVRAAIVRPARGAFAYHDPCFLGRRRGVYEAPRALLALALGGRPPVELPSAREAAWCSGAGGPYAKLWPDRAARIRARRIAEFRETGAASLATACPSCVRAFRKDLLPGAVKDIASVLAEAMALAP